MARKFISFRPLFAFLLFSVLIGLFGNGLSRRIRKCSENSCPECFYNMLTLNWPQSVCKLEDNFPNPKTCRPNLPQQFTIHGLWPQLSHLSSMISYCKDNKENFDVKLLGSIHHNLNATWPSAYALDAASFWKHEWEKHGTCTNLKMKEYFNQSLILYDKFPIMEWFAKADITPNDSRPYPIAQISSALERHIPKSNFALKCQTHSKSKQTLLKEIWVCVKYANLNSGNPCSFVTSTCSGNVFLPKSF